MLTRIERLQRVLGILAWHDSTLAFISSREKILRAWQIIIL
jgi:hypothetical protein